MNPVYLYRFLAFLVLFSGGIGLYLFANRIILHKVKESARSLPLQKHHKPAILYFTTPDCVPCRTMQRPAIESIKHLYGDRLEVIEIDAYQQPDMVRDWRVLSVPTTFILDENGSPVHVNHGVTRTEELVHQLTKAGLSSAETPGG